MTCPICSRPEEQRQECPCEMCRNLDIDPIREGLEGQLVVPRPRKVRWNDPMSPEEIAIKCIWDKWLYQVTPAGRMS